VRPSAALLPAVVGAVAVWMHWRFPFRDHFPLSPGEGRVRANVEDATTSTLALTPTLSRRERGKRAGVAGAVGILAVVVVLLPWAWRNHQVLGRWLWSSSNDGFTAYDGFHPAATGASDQSFIKQMSELSGMTELQRSDYLAAQARQYAREHPSHVVELTIRKLLRTWSPVPLSREYGTRLYVAVGLLFSVPFDVFAIIGLFSRRLSPSVKLFLIVPALYFTAIHAMSVGSLRYRIPAEPALAVLVAVGFMASLEWWLTAARRRRAVSSASPSASATETPATRRSGK
jgi:hypothetical protein